MFQAPTIYWVDWVDEGRRYGIVQPQHNKSRQIRCLIKNGTAEILASAELNPRDSLRRRKKDSDISRNIIWLILKEKKLKPY